MENHEVEDKFKEFEAKILEQEHRLFPVWYNCFTKRKYSSNDKRRNAINKRAASIR